jgi:SEC-C motif-containing protein
MRSRYSAFVLGNTGYLLASWHATTRPDADTFALEPETRWLGLEVRATKTLDSNHAEVEFVARYRREGRGHRLHEISRFVLEGGHWSYVDGTHPEKAKDRP